MVTYHKLPRLHGFEGNIYGTPSFTCTIPSLEGASVWASDSSTQWLIVVNLICVRLRESLFKTIVTGIFPQVHFHFCFGDTVTRFQVKQSFCSQYATMLQQFCKYILHWMRKWAFARKWLVIPWTRAALAVPCTYVDAALWHCCVRRLSLYPSKITTTKR